MTMDHDTQASIVRAAVGDATYAAGSTTSVCLGTFRAEATAAPVTYIVNYHGVSFCTAADIRNAAAPTEKP